jgi:PAS domain S-box-containing protein
MEVSDFSLIRGCPWPDLWQGQGHVEAKAAIEVAKAGGAGRFRNTAKTLAGNSKCWDVQVSPIKGANGRPERLLVVSRDITAEFQTEAAVRESAAYIRLLLESTAEGFYAIDCDGRTTMSNSAFRRILGISDESSIMGVRLHDVVHHSHPDGSNYPASDCPIYACARDGISAHVDGELFWRLDGTPVPVEYWAHPIIENDVLQGAICTFRYVTEQTLAKAAVRESEARFRHLADSAPALIWMTDEHGHWIFANLHFDHVFGRANADFVAGEWDKVVLAHDLPAFDIAFTQDVEHPRATLRRRSSL